MQVFRSFRDIFRKDNWSSATSARVGEMLDTCVSMNKFTYRVLIEGMNDAEAQAKLYDRDQHINVLEREVRRSVVTHLALEQRSEDIPSGLIFMNVVKDAERIGDYLKNIYDVAHDLMPEDADRTIYKDRLKGFADIMRDIMRDIVRDIVRDIIVDDCGGDDPGGEATSSQHDDCSVPLLGVKERSPLDVPTMTSWSRHGRESGRKTPQLVPTPIAPSSLGLIHISVGDTHIAWPDPTTRSGTARIERTRCPLTCSLARRGTCHRTPDGCHFLELAHVS
jgi:hypothetical protein